MANIAETADVYAANLTSSVASIISNTTNLHNNETFDFECQSISKFDANALKNTSFIIEGNSYKIMCLKYASFSCSLNHDYLLMIFLKAL